MKGGPPVLLELFSGTKSFTKVWRSHGGLAYTFDLDDRFDPDLLGDIMDLEVDDIPEPFRYPDVVWASPPCQAFSVSTICFNWIREDGISYPASEKAADSLLLLDKLAEILDQLAPRFYFIENPVGMMRRTPINQGRMRRTVTYCQYGDHSQKPTDIWTNCHHWVPRAACARIKPGDPNPCHAPAPRTSHNVGTQSKVDAMARGIIPVELCEEIFQATQMKPARDGQRTLGAFA